VVGIVADISDSGMVDGASYYVVTVQSAPGESAPLKVTGKIDDVRNYQGALSAAEVAALMQS
jgi:hypothetical protein